MKGLLTGTLLLVFLITLGCTEADTPSPTGAPGQTPTSTHTPAPEADTPLPTFTPTGVPSQTPTSTQTPAPEADTPLPTFTPAGVPSQTPTSTQMPAPDPSPSIVPSVASEVGVTYNRRTPYVPLDNPLLLPADAADYLDDDDLILGLEWEGKVHAYPVRMVTFHHIVNDTLAGKPFVITY